MRSLNRVVIVALLYASTGALSCSDAATQVIVDRVEVLVGAALTDLSIGQTVQAEAIARSASGDVLTGQTITWSSSNPAVATVSAAGVVTAVAPGTAIITASTGGHSANVTATVKGPTTTATQLFILTQPPTTAQAGTVLAQQPAVQLRDASGSAVAQAGVPVTATTATGATVGGTSTATTNASGVATFTGLTVNGLIGPRTLVFQSGTLTAATSGTITITAGALAQLVMTVQPSAGAVSGDTIAVQPVVGLTDAFTNPITQAGVSITAQVASGSGTLAGTATAVTNASGAALFSGLSINGSSTHTLKFTSGTLAAATSAPINVIAPLILVSYDKYASTTAMLADCAAQRGQAETGSTPFYCAEQQATSDAGVPGYNAGDITLDPTVPAPGLTKSMRYHYNHPGNGCNTITLRRYIAIPARQEFWSEFSVRWSANFTTANLPCAPNDHKFIFGDTQADQSARWALYVGSDGDQGVHTLREEIGTQPGVVQNQFYLNKNNHGKPGELFAEKLWDGNWHVIRFHMRSSTTTSSADGRYRIWIDGVLLHDQAGFSNFRNDGTNNPDPLWGIDFTHNQDDGPALRDMYIWWGRVRIFGSDPGWQ